MDIVNFDALKAQGKVLPANDVDLTEDYFLIGKRNVHYNTNSFKATEYPIYAIKAGDVIGANTKYKVYTALLTQTGLNNPVATVLENTLGFIPAWTRTAPGGYQAINIEWGTYASNKIMVFLTLCSYGDNGGARASYVNDDKVVVITTRNLSGVSSDDILSDSDLYSATSIEIRIYN